MVSSWRKSGAALYTGWEVLEGIVTSTRAGGFSEDGMFTGVDYENKTNNAFMQASHALSALKPV